MNEKKDLIFLRFTPKLRSFTNPAGEGYTSSALGDLFRKRISGDDGVLFLTKSDIDYVRGLADAHVMGANELLEALQKSDSVEVTVETRPRT